LEHNLVQDCPVFLGIKSIRKAEKKGKRKTSATPPKQPKTDLWPHCKKQVKAKKNYQNILLKNAKTLTGIEKIKRFVINPILLIKITL
jgi:hypothetical protein